MNSSQSNIISRTNTKRSWYGLDVKGLGERNPNQSDDRSIEDSIRNNADETNSQFLQRKSKRNRIGNTQFKDFLMSTSLIDDAGDFSQPNLDILPPMKKIKKSAKVKSQPISSRKHTGSKVTSGSDNKVHDNAVEKLLVDSSSLSENVLDAVERPLVDSKSLSETVLNNSTDFGPLNSSAPQYLSNESVSDDENIFDELKKKKMRGAGKDWIFVESFTEREAAEEKMESMKDFTRDYIHGTTDGRKFYFSCKSKACPAMYQLFCSSDTTLMLKSSDHNHTSTSAAPAHLTRIPPETKSKIQEYREMKLKPRAIISSLRNNHPELPVPTIKQLYGLNARASTGQSKISLSELEQWITERSAIPDDVHTVFVVNYQIDYDIPHFRFFLSTKNLLEQTNKSKIVHGDTTYKLNYEGFPVLVVGVTDLDRHLHPSGISVCTDEQTEDFEFIFRSLVIGIHNVCGKSFLPTTLVADAAGAIHNGFTNVFGNLLIIMCWAHLKRAVKKRYKGRILIEALLNDLDVLQLSPSVESFHIALKLFFEKWKTEDEFTSYFKEQWVNQNGNWFEGIQKFTPKTDNALEGKNKWIKDNHTKRERRPLVQFLDELLVMVNDWSCEYIQDKVFAFEQTIDLPTWTKCYQWVKSSKSVKIVSNGENNAVHVFKVPATGFDTVVEFDLNQCKSLEEFKKNVFAFYIVEMPPNDWKKGTCTCPSFFKLFICKHFIGMAMRYKLVEPPLSAKNIPIGQKRKRGRPRKAKHALIVQ